MLDLRGLFDAISPGHSNGDDSTEVNVSAYSDPFYCVEDLVSVFVKDCASDISDNTSFGAGTVRMIYQLFLHLYFVIDLDRPKGWQQHYLMVFLEGSIVVSTGSSPGVLSQNSNSTKDGPVVTMKGGYKQKLSSKMTGNSLTYGL